MSEPITETIGVDLGDKYSVYCVLDQVTGEEVESGRIRTTPEAFARFFGPRNSARVVMEVGTHSPWASRVVAATCAETYVANARELCFIYMNQRKSDGVDAEGLARVGRMDPKLLHPIRHRGEQAQRDLTLIRARSTLVATRTKLVNSLRGLVKTSGGRMAKQAPQSMGNRTLDRVPPHLRETLAPMLLAIEFLTDHIQGYDREIDRLAEERYPETAALTQVTGVGNLTALAFVLTLEDPAHFARSRDVGPFLGLVPKRDQSGATDKPLPISKAGDRLVRTLLVQCAHQILRRDRPDTDLKRAGERITRGGAIAKRKAVVAVSRKLAVLLHALWKTGEVYEPLRRTRAA